MRLVLVTYPSRSLSLGTLDVDCGTEPRTVVETHAILKKNHDWAVVRGSPSKILSKHKNLKKCLESGIARNNYFLSFVVSVSDSEPHGDGWFQGRAGARGAHWEFRESMARSCQCRGQQRVYCFGFGERILMLSIISQILLSQTFFMLLLIKS